MAEKSSQLALVPQKGSLVPHKREEEIKVEEEKKKKVSSILNSFCIDNFIAGHRMLYDWLMLLECRELRENKDEVCSPMSLETTPCSCPSIARLSHL